MPLLDGLNFTGLALATVLPWLAGASATRLLLPGASVTLLLGHGYLTGQLLVIGLVLFWNQLGLTLAWWPLASAMTLFTAVLIVLTAHRQKRRTGALITAPQIRLPLPHLKWRDLLWLLPLLLFLWMRGSVMAEELSLRPLYPWDAWMNWAPRAIVWFEHGSLTAFAAPEVWLQAAPHAELYTLGNRAASDYPPGIPLLLLWQMLGVGSSDHTLIYLPWLLLPFAAGLALWGHLRDCKLGRIPAALAVYLLLSMPLANTHAVLPGYADLWLGVAFAMGAMALAQWQHSGCGRYAVLTLAMALLCALLKNPGLGFAALLLIGVLITAWRPAPQWIARFTGAGLAFLLLGLLAGLNPEWVAKLDASAALSLPGALPELRLRLSPLLPFLGQAFFMEGNWHLLMLLLPVVVLTSLILRGPRSLYHIDLLMLLAGFALLIIVFGFTQYARSASTGVTFHRALLYVTPLAVFTTFRMLTPLLLPRERKTC